MRLRIKTENIEISTEETQIITVKHSDGAEKTIHRFKGVSLPQGAKIISADLVYSQEPPEE